MDERDTFKDEFLKFQYKQFSVAPENLGPKCFSVLTKLVAKGSKILSLVSLLPDLRPVVALGYKMISATTQGEEPMGTCFDDVLEFILNSNF